MSPVSELHIALGESKVLHLNGALEYNKSSGNGTNTPAKYELTAYGFHLGAQFDF